MPGMYARDDFDLAGFSVGVVEKSKVLDRAQVQHGDIVVGLASSGAHSNGYSLIRKVIEVSGASLDMPFANTTLVKALLKPTRIYVKPILHAIKQFDIHAISHITGGGLTENLPRVLPKHSRAIIDLSAWKRPAIFAWLQQEGNIEDAEMLRTFNCGIGMTVIVPEQDVEDLINAMRLDDIAAWPIGHIEAGDTDEPCVNFING
jgi:phosphoribosylformylglycinamidine cyclo-ligase